MKLSLIMTLLVGAVASPASAVLYTAGHGDIGIAYEEEPGEPPEFFFHNHVSPNAVVDGVSGNDEEFEAGVLTIVVPASTMLSQTDSDLDTGTGVSGGAPIWVLPQSQSVAQTQGAPYLGFATEELVSTEWGMITFELISVTSPSGSGTFSAWDFDGFGNPSFHLSSNSVGDNSGITVPAGGEAHFNLGFSELGDWGIELRVSGTSTDPSIGFQESTETFNFSVVPEPSSALLALLGSLALIRRRRS